MRAWLLLVVAACGGARPAPEALRNRAATPPKPACVESRLTAIAAHLEARWNARDVDVVRCTPGLFPLPGYFLEVDDGRARRVGITTVDGTIELVPFAIEATQLLAMEVVERATVDLDGDGVDEVVETWREQPHGRLGANHWLEIRRIVDDRLATLRGPHTSVAHPELGGCVADVRLAGQTIVITVATSHGLPPSDCLATGTHTFALDGDAIVEIDATRVSRR